MLTSSFFSLTPMPSGGGCRPQGRQERENVAGPRRGNDRSRGSRPTIFTVCQRSGSPSSVIRLAGDRRMPPSPAGGRKWRLRIRRGWRLGFGVAARRAGIGAPYKGGLRIRRTFSIVFGAAAGAVGTPAPTRCPLPFPPPAGEGAAHKGGRRGRTWRDLAVEMTAAVGVGQRFLPSASGRVLPLPSSASRGIGGCHLPPLGEGNDGYGFAGLGRLLLVLLRNVVAARKRTR